MLMAKNSACNGDVCVCVSVCVFMCVCMTPALMNFRFGLLIPLLCIRIDIGSEMEGHLWSIEVVDC